MLLHICYAAVVGSGTRVILDGEVCAWDRTTQCYLPFGNNAAVRNKEREVWLASRAASTSASSSQSAAGSQRGGSSGATTSSADGSPAPKDWDKDLTSWCMFVAFDVIFLEGPQAQTIIQAALQECGIFGRYVPPGEITNLPLVVRRSILTKVVAPIPNRVDIVPSRIVTTQDTALRKEQIESYFNELTLAGEEGLVIKNLNSCYELGEKSRGMALWVKMKPEYGDQTEDLDLLILGDRIILLLIALINTTAITTALC